MGYQRQTDRGYKVGRSWEDEKWTQRKAQRTMTEAQKKSQRINKTVS